MTDKQILELIRLNEIRDQNEFLELINAKSSSPMPQSTLSRRLHKLGVKKKHGVCNINVLKKDYCFSNSHF